MVREYSAGLVIFRKDNDSFRYLFLKGNQERLDLPKGNVKQNEEPIEAAKRESVEETGLTDLKISRDFKNKTQYFYFRSNGQKVYKTVVYFLAETNSKDVKISSEHSGFEWLTINEALKRIIYKSMRELLIEAEKFRLKMLKS